MRRHCFTGFCCLLLFSSSVYAQQKTATTPALGPNLGTVRQSRCQQALTTPLPAESNEPAYAPGSSHAKINSISLYYRLNDQQRDYTRARHLAWGERNAYATHPGGSPIFTGPLVLAMIYANGLDTPRNPALALRMACEATAYPNNLGPEELDRLQSILDSKSIPPPPFEVCTPQPNDVGTKELCYTLAYAQQNQRWSDQVDVLAQSWPADQKAALANLKPAAFEFFRTSSIYEWQAITPGASLGSNGALPPDWYKPANKLLQDNFLSAMQGLETGHPPITTKLTSAQADAQLNTQYRSFDDRLRVDFNGSTTVLSVPSERNIQRLWLAYRDAFLALIRLRRPQLTAQWNAQLTADRTQTLIKLIDLLSSIDHPSAQPWLATCAHYRSTPLPPEFHDIDESAAKEAPSCFAYKSYYGLGTPVDFAKARTCAIQERVQYGYYHDIGIDQSDPSSPVGTEINGPVILTMIYANGDGTSRSIPLALRFACEAIDNRQVGSPEVFSNEEENQTIVPDLLNAIQQTSRTTKPLDMCERVPGLARMQTVCDLIGQVREQQTHDHDIAMLAATFTPEQRTAFLHLVDTLHAYYNAHDEQETEVMGHFLFSGGWDGIHTEREQAFIDDIHRFEAGHLPSYTAAQYATTDRDLNAAFQQAITDSKEHLDPQSANREHRIGDAPTPTTLRATERLWLNYRDVLADFGHLRYPQITRESWLTWVTLQRTKDLKNPCFFDATCK